MAPRVKRSKNRRPKVDPPPFDPTVLHWSLIELLMFAAVWERGANPRRSTIVKIPRSPEERRRSREERRLARREDEAFLRDICDRVHAHVLTRLLALAPSPGGIAQQLIPYDRVLAAKQASLAAALKSFREGEIGEANLVQCICDEIGRVRVSAEEVRTLITWNERGPDGELVASVHKWIKEKQGPRAAAALIISHFCERAGRFAFAVEKAIRDEPCGPGGLQSRSRGLGVTPRGVPRYVLQCLGYSEEKIEAAITALNGPRWPPTSAPVQPDVTPPAPVQPTAEATRRLEALDDGPIVDSPRAIRRPPRPAAGRNSTRSQPAVRRQR